MRAHGTGDINHNSKKLIIHFCKINSLIITGTILRGLSSVADITIALTMLTRKHFRKFVCDTRVMWFA